MTTDTQDVLARAAVVAAAAEYGFMLSCCAGVVEIDLLTDQAAAYRFSGWPEALSWLGAISGCEEARAA